MQKVKTKVSKAGDFCRRFSLGHILQMNKAFGEIQQVVYTNRANVTGWTIDVDAKVHGVYGVVSG